MLFRRRARESRWDRLRIWLWPRVSWRRSWAYFVKRAVRLPATPHAVAMGCAVGAFVSCTPFFGFRLALTLALAWLLGGNLIAAALATGLGNPLTLPFLLGASYQVGAFILPGDERLAPEAFGPDLAGASLERLLPLLAPLAVGAVPVGLAAGAIAYAVVYRAVAAAQTARRRRLEARRRTADRAEGADEAKGAPT